jgi:hypothetical protein
MAESSGNYRTVASSAWVLHPIVLEYAVREHVANPSSCLGRAMMARPLQSLYPKIYTYLRAVIIRLLVRFEGT